MVIEKNLSEDRKLLEKLNQKYAKVLDDMETKCENQRSDYLKNIEIKAKDKESKLLSRAQSDAQKKILIKKNELLRKLKAELIDSLEKTTHSEGYSVFFAEQLSEALKNFDVKDDLLIGAKTTDLALVPEAYRTTADDNLLGGFYIVKNNKVKYDYTLDSEVNGIQDYLGCMTNTLFDSAGEACNEDE